MSEDEEAEGASYDNGLEALQHMKGGKKKSIRVANKFFTDLDMGFADDPADMKEAPEDMKLEIRPRTTPPEAPASSSFLEKIERFKKERGMKSNINLEEYEKEKSEQAKHSLARVISSGHSFH